jgi:DNA-binding response OmpR family regulator
MSIVPAFSNVSSFLPRPARDVDAQWVLRVSGTADTPPLAIHGREIVRVLARLLQDDRVQDVVVVRRAREVHAHVAAVPAAVLTHGVLTVDVVAREVRASGARVALTRRELDLLVFFLRNPDRAIARSELMESVWEGAAIGSWRTVDIHVRRLRAKLAHIPFPLETLVRVGYRFTTRARLGGESHA